MERDPMRPGIVIFALWLGWLISWLLVPVEQPDGKAAGDWHGDPLPHSDDVPVLRFITHGASIKN
jgi:hypothetical protein